MANTQSTPKTPFLKLSDDACAWLREWYRHRLHGNHAAAHRAQRMFRWCLAQRRRAIMLANREGGAAA